MLRWVVVGVLLVIVLTGCAVFVRPDAADTEAVTAYNAQVYQMFQLLERVLAGVVAGAVTLVGLWFKMNHDRQITLEQHRLTAAALAAKTEEEASKLAVKTEHEVEKLALASQARSDKVIAAVEENKAINATAILVANNHNEKIIKLQQQHIDIQAQLAAAIAQRPARNERRLSDSVNVHVVNDPLVVVEKKV